MKYFGTDGIRGLYGKDITLDIVENACLGIASVLNQDDVMIVARDPRISSEAIFEVVINTLNKNGIKVYDLGIVPTPFVSLMIKHYQAKAGIMISASHNPYSDNGIKFFDERGVKISDELEAKIEQIIDNPIVLEREQAITEFVETFPIYLNIIKTICSEVNNLHIALDCANGASSRLARDIYLDLGAELTVIGDKPDGYNINDNVGALHPQTLAGVVVEHNCDCGFCFDGDADRIICIDRNGKILTGDHIIFLLATYLQKYNLLKDNTVVVTSMTNMGVIKQLKELGIHCQITDVGDRFVIQKMLEKNYNLGGEQSGHIILSDYITTGDGILASVFVTSIINKQHDILEVVEDYVNFYPQQLKNLQVKDKYAIMKNDNLKTLIEQANQFLGEAGRVVIRASGTENLVRIMAEANKKEVVEQIITYFEDVIKSIERSLCE